MEIGKPHHEREVSHKIQSGSMNRSIPVKHKSFYCLFLTFLLLGGGLGCERQTKDQQESAVPNTLSVWAHAGQEAERKVLQTQIARFNQQSSITHSTF